MLPEIPYNNWKPRPDQMALWSYLQSGGLRAVEVAHRRWGKDDIALHRTAIASTRRVGNYWHMLPQFNQCRKAIWEAVNPRTGMKRIDEAFPEDMRSSTRTTDMYIGMKNGSSWQLVGSDIPELNDVKSVKGLVDFFDGKSKNALSRWYSMNKKLSTLRENILRLASNRYFMDRLGNGEIVYGASRKTKTGRHLGDSDVSRHSKPGPQRNRSG